MDVHVLYMHVCVLKLHVIINMIPIPLLIDFATGKGTEVLDTNH